MEFARIRAALAAIALGGLCAAPVAGQPAMTFDMLTRDPDAGDYFRGFGFANSGVRGTPVAGGYDMDGDGSADSALALMQSAPNGLSQAGRVAVFFGDGTVDGEVDGAVRTADVMHIVGAQTRENIGSEIWMGDVTGDGLGDLLVCRQNHTPAAGRTGAGALSIIVGSPALRTYAATLGEYAIGAPPASVSQFDIVGRNEFDRLGIWARMGDVDGDGVDDVVVAADQSDVRGTHSGEIWVVRGGPHLATTVRLDLLDFGSSAFEGHLARIVPPTGSEQHLGSTLHVHDLDGNGRAEIVACVDALNRSGAGLSPAGGSFSTTHASSQESREGSGWIAWDDNFPAAPWPAGFTIDLAAPAGTTSRVRGPSGAGSDAGSFGEEIIGGVDLDNDGTSDLLFGDLVALSQRGRGYVLYNAPALKNLVVDLDVPGSIPAALGVVQVHGPSTGSIGLDTVMMGDFDGDGIGDLAIGNPEDNPLDRSDAGSIHVLYGKTGRWPSPVDLRPGFLPPTADVRIAMVVGRHQGDVLCYSAAYGDMDGDGRTDIITNEMTGDGVLPEDANAGTLILIPGSRLLDPPALEGTWMLIR